MHWTFIFFETKFAKFTLLPFVFASVSCYAFTEKNPVKNHLSTKARREPA